jgi:ankyrin repeat protein
LISAGVLRNTDGETLLIVGARCGHAAVVDRFRNEIEIDEVDNDGWSALLCASHQGHADCVRLLLEAHASIDQPGKLFTGMIQKFIPFLFKILWAGLL